MKPGLFLPLATVLGTTVPATNVAAEESRAHNPLDRVHFNQKNGRLTLRRPDKLSLVEREEALVEALLDFRELVDGCLEWGTQGDTKVGPYEEQFTVNCGEGGPVVSCAFEEGRSTLDSLTRVDDELRITCTYPSGDVVTLEHTVRGRVRYVESAQSEAEQLRPGACVSKAGCVERITQVETGLSGTNSRKKRTAGGRSKLTLLSTVIQINDGTMEVTAGPDSFGDSRRYLLEAISALQEFLSGVREKFLEKIRSKEPSSRKKAEGLLAVDLREL